MQQMMPKANGGTNRERQLCNGCSGYSGGAAFPGAGVWPQACFCRACVRIAKVVEKAPRGDTGFDGGEGDSRCCHRKPIMTAKGAPE